MISGKNIDKSVFLRNSTEHFGCFYDPEIPNLIRVNIVESHEFTTHICIIKEIIATLLNADCLIDCKPYPMKINLLLLVMDLTGN